MGFEKLIVQICQILDNLKITYAITGGYAVSVWGHPRSTMDIDVVIELYKNQAHELTMALEKISKMSYIDEESIIRALDQIGEFNYIHSDSGLKVDFYIAGRDKFSHEKLNRRIKKKILDKSVCFVSPEDLILSKLIWHKESPTGRQLDDVESILRISGKKLDYKYLKTWATKLDLENILNEVLKDNS